MTIRTSLPLALLLALLATAASPAAAMIAPAPPAPPGWAYRWVPPTYRTVFDRLWIPQQCTPVVDWVEISPGHFVQTWRNVLTPGHWQTTTRRELLDPGHWELVALAPPPRFRPLPVEPIPMPLPRPVVLAPTGTVPVEGYSSGPGEDLSAFSGLREWPEKH
jgi:hypothetical protein